MMDYAPKDKDQEQEISSARACENCQFAHHHVAIGLTCRRSAPPTSEHEVTVNNGYWCGEFVLSSRIKEAIDDQARKKLADRA